MKKVIRFLLMALMLVAMVGGCATSNPGTSTQVSEAAQESQSMAEETASTSSTTGNESGIVIGVASLDLTQEFYVHMIDGSNQAAEEDGVTVSWKSADSNLDKQIALIENFIQQGVDCIMIDPYDSAGLIPVCEEAAAAGIPVLSMGNFIDSDAVVSCLYNDYQDTKVIGEIDAKLCNETGDVALLYGAAGNYVSDERQRGFEEAIAKYSNMKCTSLAIGWDSATALKVTQDLLASNPNIKAIHCFSDGETGAVYQAVEQAGLLGKVLISSYDGNKDASQAVKEGKYVLTLLTGAKRVGYWCTKMAVKLANGEKLDQKNYLKSHFIMNDDLKAKVEEWGIGYDGMSIITPDEGIAMFDDMSAGFDQ